MRSLPGRPPSAGKLTRFSGTAKLYATVAMHYSHRPAKPRACDSVRQHATHASILHAKLIQDGPYPHLPAKPRGLNFGGLRQHDNLVSMQSQKIRFDRNRMHGANGTRPRATHAFTSLLLPSPLSRCLIKRLLKIHILRRFGRKEPKPWLRVVWVVGAR